LPKAGFQVNQPEIIKHGFLWSGAAIDEDMPGRQSERNVTLPGRNGILLFNLAPIVGGLSEFELEEVVGELNR
jgi:hypothetical protein